MVLSIDQLTKKYGSITALNAVSFDVPPGSVFGILGPNGSGKTTLLGIVMDVLKATSGRFTWEGNNNSAAHRREIGTLLETPNFYHYLSGEANLRIAAKIKQRGENDIEKVLHMVNLYERRKSKFSSYSLGMKQRLAIASALLGDPAILVFDEPTNGLDPAGIAEIRDLIRQLNRQGKTIIMASHILDEVERVCSHVAIIQRGVLKTLGTVSSVLSGAEGGGNYFEISAPDLDALAQSIRQMPGILGVVATDVALEIQAADTVDAASVNAWCFQQGITLHLLTPRKKNLEARFLEITGTKSDR